MCNGDTVVLAREHEPDEIAKLVGFHGSITPRRDGDPADLLHRPAMTGPKTDVPPLARTPVFGAALALGVALSAFSAGYGYERDELYFRMLPPAWGYIDQGPLTPLIARGMRDVLGDQTWTVRIAATLATMATVVVIALLTREFGGGRAAQALAAWGFAFAAYPMILGHTLLTATVDMPVWPAVVLFIVRAVKRAEPRWWLAAGAVAGVSLYNKLLVAVLLIALVVGPARGRPAPAAVVTVGGARGALDRLRRRRCPT